MRCRCLAVLLAVAGCGPDYDVVYVTTQVPERVAPSTDFTARSAWGACTDDPVIPEECGDHCDPPTRDCIGYAIRARYRCTGVECQVADLGGPCGTSTDGAPVDCGAYATLRVEDEGALALEVELRRDDGDGLRYHQRAIAVVAPDTVAIERCGFDYLPPYQSFPTPDHRAPYNTCVCRMPATGGAALQLRVHATAAGSELIADLTSTTPGFVCAGHFDAGRTCWVPVPAPLAPFAVEVRWRDRSATATLDPDFRDQFQPATEPAIALDTSRLYDCDLD